MLGAAPWHGISNAVATPRIAASGPDADPSCIAAFTEPNDSAGSPPHVSVFVVTQARLHRQGGTRAYTRRYVESFVAESQASGWTVEAVQGAWRDGRLMSRPGVPAQLQLLLEDEGVAISISADGVERGALLRFASAVASRLRGQALE